MCQSNQITPTCQPLTFKVQTYLYMFNWTCHGLVLAVAKPPAHELRHISMGGAQMNAVINMCSLPLLRFREDKQRWGGLVCGTTRTGSELAAAWFIPVCFSALSFVFKADWHRNSDVATWSIWPLIPASVLRTAQMMPPPPSFFFHCTPEHASVRLQPSVLI